MAETLSKVTQLESGIYQEAAKMGLSLTGYLKELARKGELSGELFDPELKNSEGERLNPFQQLLLNRGIRTKGALAQTADAFFTDNTNKILFPEFVATAYRDQERTLPAVFIGLDDLVTNREGIQGNAHKSGMLSSDQDNELEFGRIAEGANLPVYTVKTAERAVDLFKYGGELRMTYESLRRVKIPMLSRYIGKISRAQVRRKIKRALAVAKNGDGNSNPAPNTATRGTTVAFPDLIDLVFEAARASVDASKLIGDANVISQILMQFILTDSGRPADRTVAFTDGGGTLPSPLGMTLKLALPDSILDGSDILMSVDTLDGLVEYYEEGSEITESERLIQAQFEVITFTENIGYAKPEPMAFRTKTLKAV